MPPVLGFDVQNLSSGSCIVNPKSFSFTLHLVTSCELFSWDSFSTNLRAFTKIPPGLGLPKYQIKLKILSARSIGTLIAKVTSDSAWSRRVTFSF